MGFFERILNINVLLKIVLVLRRLRSAGNYDRSSKRSCINAFSRDRCASHSFLVEVQKSRLHMCRARAIATWRIGLRAPLFARNYKMDVTIRYLRGLFV